MNTPKTSPSMLILEDMDLLASLYRRLAKDINCIMCTTSEELHRVLEEKPPIDLFVLDNNVPANTNEKPLPHFIDNFQRVKAAYPDAKVVCTSSNPGQDVIETCKENRVEMIDKMAVKPLIEERPKK